MKDKELKRLNRAELLELLLEQKKKNEQLEAELEQARKELESKDIAIQNSGSIAEASLKLTAVFEEAQKAADLYLANVRQSAGISGTEYDHPEVQQSELVSVSESNAEDIHAAESVEMDNTTTIKSVEIETADASDNDTVSSGIGYNLHDKSPVQEKTENRRRKKDKFKKNKKDKRGTKGTDVSGEEKNLPKAEEVIEVFELMADDNALKLVSELEAEQENHG